MQTRDDSLNLKLRDAIINNDYAQVKYIMENNLDDIDINYSDNKNTNLLTYAILGIAERNGDQRILELLINNKVEMKITGDSKYPLLLAIASNSAIACHVLLNRNNSVEICNFAQYGQVVTFSLHPLMQAVRKNNTEITRDLLEHGWDFKKYEPESDILNDIFLHNVLQIAISNQNSEICRLLMMHGVDPNGSTIKMSSAPLSSAAKIGNIEICRILVNYGARLDHVSKSNATAMMYAAKHHNIDLLVVLTGHENDIIRGVNYLVDELIGELQALYAQHIGVQNIIKQLQSGKRECISDILHLLLNINAQAVGIEQVASVAIKSRTDLIRKCVDVCLLTGGTPLHLAAGIKNLSYVSAFLAMGFDPNAKNFLGMTPLHAAAYIPGNLEVIKHLCEHGGDAKIKNKQDITPVDLAIRNRDDDVINYFQVGNDKLHEKQSVRKVHVEFGLMQRQPERMHGGTEIEGFIILSEYFEKFALERGNRWIIRMSDNFKAAALHSQMNPDMLLKILVKNGELLSSTGFIGHVLGYSITRQDDGCYQLTLAERGYFISKMPGYNQDSEKHCSLQSITIREDMLLDVITLLKETRLESAVNAEIMLFEKLPLMVRSEWFADESSSQSPLKAGTCFHDNMKSLLLNELYKVFTDNKVEAKKIYKEFLLFMQKEISNEYHENVINRPPEIESLIQQSIETRHERLRKFK